MADSDQAGRAREVPLREIVLAVARAIESWAPEVREGAHARGCVLQCARSIRCGALAQSTGELCDDDTLGREVARLIAEESHA